MMLQDRLEDAVADVSADLHALTAASRRQGLAIRRRRRALTTVGSVAAVTALAVGAALVGSGSDGRSGSVATEGPAPTAAPLSGRTAPITERGAPAALAAAVGRVADGTVSRLQGQTYDDGRGPEAMAALLLEPAGSTGVAGQVFLNLQPGSAAGAAPYACSELPSPLTDCVVRQLPGGDTLRTYREDGDSEFGPGSQRLVAEVISPRRHLRVVVYAMNTNPWADGAMRDEPVLTLDQLTEIATQTWWSRTDLPAEYVAAGRDLDLDEG